MDWKKIVSVYYHSDEGNKFVKALQEYDRQLREEYRGQFFFHDSCDTISLFDPPTTTPCCPFCGYDLANAVPEKPWVPKVGEPVVCVDTRPRAGHPTANWLYTNIVYCVTYYDPIRKEIAISINQEYTYSIDRFRPWKPGG